MGSIKSGETIEPWMVANAVFFSSELECGQRLAARHTLYDRYFKCGRVNLSDEFHDGRPSTAVNYENIDAVRRMIRADRRVT
ncbi:hypothetical protein EVAR_81972_1 [Eumeta japonica]|uniref:Uncharacterized protein n=1 Tax=Eumeta variegata TaxID=151549 RepID=A0A4C1VVU8_EUMVA|nr:hypothetical protein EVAR_81972_1 [Eumeta japonica]